MQAGLWISRCAGAELLCDDVMGGGETVIGISSEINGFFREKGSVGNVGQQSALHEYAWCLKGEGWKTYMYDIHICFRSGGSQ